MSTPADGLLNGKVALITGASTGIGCSSAEVFVRHGARVLLADINQKDGEELARRLRDGGAEAHFVAADVSQAKDVEAMVAEAVSRFGRLDCAFNNAGIDGAFALTADCTEENWDRTIAVNLKGIFLCMKYEIARMLEQGGGAIVNTASVAGLVGVGMGLPAYVAAKHGVVGLTRAAALEYATKGIRVNAVCPGAIRTPMLDDAIRQGLASEEAMVAMEPIRRLGRPDEIGEAAAWLCSDRAGFILGHALAVDGGWIAG